MDIAIIISIIVLSLAGPLIGSLLGVLLPASERMLYHLLAFAAGVMIGISVFQLIPEALTHAPAYVILGGLGTACLVMLLIDRLPMFKNRFRPENLPSPAAAMQRSALFIMISFALHNVPEGMSMAIGQIGNTNLSLMVALALAAHDIPEGICTAAPYYAATANRKRAFVLSAVTGIPTVIGFVLAIWLFNLISPALVAFLMAVTAGIMIFVSVYELIPASCRQLTRHRTAYSFMTGLMLVMMLGMG